MSLRKMLKCAMSISLLKTIKINQNVSEIKNKWANYKIQNIFIASNSFQITFFSRKCFL